MNSTPVSNIVSNIQPASPARAGARQSEAADNPFQQMLSEELAGKDSPGGQAEHNQAAAPAAPPEKPAAKQADQSQAGSDAAEKDENEHVSLSPELSAMIAGLMQRQEGTAEEGDPLTLLGKALRQQEGEAQEAQLDLAGARLTSTQLEEELDLQTALGRQGLSDTLADEAPQTGFSSTLQQLTQTAHAGAARNAQALPTHHIPQQVGSSGWDQAIAQRVVWMASGSEQSASLTLNPPELGPVQVVLNISNSQANATFVAAHMEVRQALEAALPKLREMLGDVGIQLDQASVNQGSPEQQGEFARSEGQGGRSLPTGVDGGTLADEAVTMRPIPASGNGLVDTFA